MFLPPPLLFFCCLKSNCFVERNKNKNFICDPTEWHKEHTQIQRLVVFLLVFFRVIEHFSHIEHCIESLYQFKALTFSHRLGKLDWGFLALCGQVTLLVKQDSRRKLEITRDQFPPHFPKSKNFALYQISNTSWHPKRLPPLQVAPSACRKPSRIKRGSTVPQSPSPN